ncbi:2,4-dihydroxyhept-2-ene-1,7-dioic acid aldolase [Acrocarpospora phusangensis]|uniref:2,4-dihydroxyhept-2-ene-1,7-dioic acid aldolase n=1 Tax=Acrocarpospora phusangensis TaxID=1070424 RepID=A0A919ULR2_9ACTN|nr:aldolase/citrate lyase family protein [Acrocarpospora phusangensis]GIH22533.1 2,4-dihydroxyhept-2-ene-1,7-dioic acid aldolase [Acrocarpospora phusangensis]
MTFFMTSPRVGTWIKLATVESVEIMAYAGFDFVVIDLEHSPLDLGLTAQMIAMAAASGVDPLVRVPDHQPSTIQRVLDAGAKGILAPHVDSAEEARRVVSAVRFPPFGSRGAGSTSRAGRWGLTPRAEYLRTGNEDAICVLQLESPAAVAAADEILAVPGVDAVFLGAGDLSVALGVETNDPDLLALLGRARAAAARAGKPCGAACVDGPSAARAVALGHQFVIMGNDATMLARTARTMVYAFREEKR